jgi:hypothetical protein
MVDPVLVTQIEAALLARGAVRQGRHLRIRCPAPEHADQHPSADVDLTRGWVCRSCGRSGSLRSLARLLGLVESGNGTGAPLAPRTARDIIAEWRRTGPRPMVPRRRASLDRDYARVVDWLRRSRALIAERRRHASELGDSDEAWRMLAALSKLGRDLGEWEEVLEVERRDAT